MAPSDSGREGEGGVGTSADYINVRRRDPPSVPHSENLLGFRDVTPFQGRPKGRGQIESTSLSFLPTGGRTGPEYISGNSTDRLNLLKEIGGKRRDEGGDGRHR